MSRVETIFSKRRGITLYFVSILLLCLVFAHPQQTQAASAPNGRKLFSQQCVKCHGRDGEGVKGKYDDPLRGEKTLEKLTRYIERNMPEDKPGTCVGENAAAVAKYIYDGFYSAEAKARKNPARVELVRLTNKQYVSTVADLLRQFTGTDAAIGKDHGLKATYYNSQHFSDKKKTFERVDGRVSFDFGEGSPDKESQTNEFSIQWRGSVIAEETGDYEFILKTPNGVRLWVNDDEEPLIDAWVSSGQATEHRATLRLLGSRAYPLRINFFRFKEKTGSISLEWKPPHGAQQVVPMRCLVTSQAKPTFVVSTPFPPDDSSVGYERGVSVSQAWDEATTQAALETAKYVTENLDTLSRTKAGDTNRAARVQAFCQEFVAAAFRRPLTEEQKRMFVSNQFKKTPKLEEAVKRVVLLTLKSPQFLYLGLRTGQPDQNDVASRLSFAMWDSLPDEELRNAASRGELRTKEQVEKQARRMLNDKRTHAKLLHFMHHWLQMDRIESLTKDQEVYPGFTPEIIADLRTSLNLFLEDSVWGGDSDYRSLLRADYLYLNKRLTEFYGVKAEEKIETSGGSGESTEEPPPEAASVNSDGSEPEQSLDEFVKVGFGGEQRSGVLTHPYLLAAFSYQKLTSPIHRGVFLTRNIVGRSLRPPPMAMTFKDADFAPNLTMRDKITQLTKPQACQSCHSVINPLGFSLESFDAVGRFRTEDNAQPVNSLSEYLTDEGEKVRLAGARDIADFALRSEQAQTAFVEQLFHHIVKQPVRAYGMDVLSQLREQFVKSNFNVQKLVMEICVVAALNGRTSGPPS